jgi:hypothetical protein
LQLQQYIMQVETEKQMLLAERDALHCRIKQLLESGSQRLQHHTANTFSFKENLPDAGPLTRSGLSPVGAVTQKSANIQVL